MHYSNIKYNDIANGPGVRTSLFVSGCRWHCKNCFNSVAWDFNSGEEFTNETLQKILDSLSSKYNGGFSLLGGEPFEPQNQKDLADILKKIKEAFPDKEIWCWTGCIYDKHLVKGGSYHTQYTDQMLKYIDVLVDGPFIQDLYDPSLTFRGSSNQRIIDVKKTIEDYNICLVEKYMKAGVKK